MDKIKGTRPYFSKKTLKRFQEIIKSKNFSNFIGSPGEKNLNKKLILTSQKLNKINEEFSFLGGKYVRLFEAKWSKSINIKFSVSVNSATSAITTALLANDISPGDEVITTPISFTASVAAIIAANGVPKFCDISLSTFCISPEAFKNAITPRTKFLLYVNWAGNAGDLDEISKIAKKNKIILIEDASHSPGHKYNNKFIGKFGKASIFSFNQPKNLMTGEGGMICTDNKDIAKKARLIRNHGEAVVDKNYTLKNMTNIIGYNFRLTEMQAAIGVDQVLEMKKLNNIRKKNFDFLINEIQKKFSHILKTQNITNSHHYAYFVAFRYIGKLKKKTFLKICKDYNLVFKEGIPRLLCDHPNIINKIAWGSKNFPWTNKKKQKMSLPNSRKLFSEYLAFYNVGWPCNLTDMKIFIKKLGDINEKYFK